MTEKEVKDFVAINFSESMGKEQNLRKVAKLLYIFLATPDNCIHHYIAKILNHFDPELQLINNIPVIKNKLKELLSKLKIDYEKINNCKIFYSSTKLIASDSDIVEAIKSMHQSIMTKIKNHGCEDWTVLDASINHRIKIFEC